MNEQALMNDMVMSCKRPENNQNCNHSPDYNEVSKQKICS